MKKSVKSIINSNRKFFLLLGVMLSLPALAVFTSRAPVQAQSGGPLVLMGIDAEDGGPGAHGPVAAYVSVTNAVFNAATNGGNGILVIGGGKSPTDSVTTFWNAVGASTGRSITYVNGATNIANQSFAGFRVIAIASSATESFGGLTQAENTALTNRSNSIASHVNNGGGLLGLSQSGLTPLYGYLSGLGTFSVFNFPPAQGYNAIDPTAAGFAIGITDALDVCCWHDLYDSFPPFLNVLAFQTGTTRAAAVGRLNAFIGTIQLSPSTATLPVGATHTLTAQVAENNIPVQNRLVTLNVLSGPNAGQNRTATTNSSGIATFTYSSSIAGTDTLRASYVDSQSLNRQSNQVTAQWTGTTGTNVTVTVNPQSVLEDGPDNLVFIFNRTGNLGSPLAVNVSTAGSQATVADSDYTQLGIGNFNGTTGTVTFNAGSASPVVTINPTADSVNEPSEVVILTITAGAGYTVGNPGSATGTIVTDDNTVVTVAVSPSSVTEDGPANLVYTFTRAGSNSNALTANFSVSGATFGTDYTQSGASSFGSTTGSVVFAVGSFTAVVTVDPTSDTIAELNEQVVLTLTNGAGYSIGTPASASGVIVDNDTGCPAMPIAYGQTISNAWDAASCRSGARSTDVYSFSATAGDQIVMTLATAQFATLIELVDGSGTVIAVSDGNANSARLPADGLRTLTTGGTYTIRASVTVPQRPFKIESPFGGASIEYTISLFREQPQACTYLIAPANTDVPPAGGTFSFDVTTAPGCPPLPAPVSGPIHTIVSYLGGRVRFSVSPNPGSAQRFGTITVGTLTHTIRQFGTAPASNDDFTNPRQIFGFTNRPDGVTPTPTPVRPPIEGFNSTATAQTGEPQHVANTGTPAKSIWYRWFPLDGSLYSFSTSGSSFDTVMAIYLCPAAGECTFANMTRVGSNDDTTTFDRTSKVNFRAIAGREYRIAIDGKNGASGTTQLSWMRYRRLYRLYLQNHNGRPANITPARVRATSGSQVVTASRISQGVYEFNVPTDNLVYTVNIDEPTGIRWNPNNFPLDSLNRSGEGVRCDGPEGGQYNTTYAECRGDGCKLTGFIKNIRGDELPDSATQICPSGRQCLGLKVGYSSSDPGSEVSTSHRDAASCRVNPHGDTFNGVPYAFFECLSRPETLQDLLPNMANKRFAIPYYRFDGVVIFSIENFEEAVRLNASDAGGETHNISGTVNSSGCTDIDLTYAPVVGGDEIVVRTKTDDAGAYIFRNLARGLRYRVKPRRRSKTFIDPPAIENLQADVTRDISEPSSCTYETVGVEAAPASGGSQDFRIRTTGQNCTIALNENVDWLDIQASNIEEGGVDGALASISTLPNLGPTPRTGEIMILGRTEPIIITQAGGFQPGIEGDLAGRPGGDGMLTATDSAQFKRFLAGFDTFADAGNNEYQRADVAPEATFGDGRLDAADQQQVNNYAAVLDPPRPAAGDREPRQASSTSLEYELAEVQRVYRVIPTVGDSRGYANAAIEMDAHGDETAVSFTLNFDATRLAIDGVSGTNINSDITLGADALAGTSITVNARQSARGIVGVLVDSGNPLPGGSRQIVNLRFRILKHGGSGSTPLYFSDDVLSRGTTNAAAESLDAVYEDGAMVVGRVTGKDSIFDVELLYGHWSWRLNGS